MTGNQQEIMKRKLLEELAKNPIIGFACAKVGLSRATYYRWREENIVFEVDANLAIAKGRAVINDLAESQLISAIKDRQISAISLWLTHNHPVYTYKNKNLQPPFRGSSRLPYDDDI